MLHSMTDVRGLDQVLDHNCRFAIDAFPVLVQVTIAVIVTVLEGLVPSIVAQLFQIFIHNVCRHDSIHGQLAESE